MARSILDNPLIWRDLVSRLNTALGIVGDYAFLHDSLVIDDFCKRFAVPIDAVSARLEAHVHSQSSAIN